MNFLHLWTVYLPFSASADHEIRWFCLPEDGASKGRAKMLFGVVLKDEFHPVKKFSQNNNYSGALSSFNYGKEVAKVV